MTAIEGFISPIIANQAIDSARSDLRKAKQSMRAKDSAIDDRDALLFEAKKVLHGQVALKNALRAALADVSPEHPLNDGAFRMQIVNEAESKTKPDDPWLPQ